MFGYETLAIDSARAPSCFFVIWSTIVRGRWYTRTRLLTLSRIHVNLGYHNTRRRLWDDWDDTKSASLAPSVCAWSYDYDDNSCVRSSVSQSSPRQSNGHRRLPKTYTAYREMRMCICSARQITSTTHTSCPTLTKRLITHYKLTGSRLPTFIRWQRWRWGSWVFLSR
ncbi:hypothetical protein BDD12DRAFT_527593 [Trichophaea hybrida]|nr:hypothetical protein BDD12DRAFT_527593 [Trichophaea hybrida]